MPFEIKGPVLVVGIGGAGCRISAEAGRLLSQHAGCGVSVMQISNDGADLACHDRSAPAGGAGGSPAGSGPGCAPPDAAAATVRVDTGAVINPTVGLIRASAYERMDEIRGRVAGHPTVLLIGNLAGRAGCAISPVISEACAAEGAKLVSLAIMPFGFERSRLFEAGVALRRLREASACTVVVDNDSLLESNPDLSPSECYGIADAAIMHMVSSLRKTDLQAGTDNLLVASRGGGTLEESLRDALKTLHGSKGAGGGTATTMRSMIYVAGGGGMPAGMLRAAAEITEGVLGAGGGRYESGSAHMTAETAAVQPIPTSASADESRVVMISTVQGMEKFEAYDPLGVVVPEDKTLDWDTPTCSIDCGLDGIYQME